MNLPPVLLVHTARFLDYRDLCSVTVCNKAFCTSLRTNASLWTNVFALLHPGINLPPSSDFRLACQLRHRTSDIKVIIVGDGGVGKTSFVRRHVSDAYERAYIATIGVEVSSLTKETSLAGPMQFRLWDTAGPEKFGGLRDGYYLNTQAAIIMFDVTSRVTYKNLPNWKRDILRVCGNIPIVICGNKVDEKPKVRPVAKFPFIQISCKANHNLQLPFAIIASRLRRSDIQVYPENIRTLSHLKPQTLLSIEDSKHDGSIDKFSPSARSLVRKEMLNLELTNTSKRLRTALTPPLLEGQSNVLPSFILPPSTPSAPNDLSTTTRLVLDRGIRQPTWFLVDELRAFPWWDELASQPWARLLVQQAPLILAEFETLRGTHPGLLAPIKASVSGKWDSLYLIQEGRECSSVLEMLPVTAHCLDAMRGHLLTGCSLGYAYFSILQPGSHIEPHCGPSNVKLRCHLPLKVSPGARMVVGTHTPRRWVMGQLWVFDDSFVHEVGWADDAERKSGSPPISPERKTAAVAPSPPISPLSASVLNAIAPSASTETSSSFSFASASSTSTSECERIVLLIDIWHPDLSTSERSSLRALLPCVDDDDDEGL